jgi:hypothetical protein
MDTDGLHRREVQGNVEFSDCELQIAAILTILIKRYSECLQESAIVLKQQFAEFVSV